MPHGELRSARLDADECYGNGFQELSPRSPPAIDDQRTSSHIA